MAESLIAEVSGTMGDRMLLGELNVVNVGAFVGNRPG